MNKSSLLFNITSLKYIQSVRSVFDDEINDRESTMKPITALERINTGYDEIQDIKFLEVNGYERNFRPRWLKQSETCTAISHMKI